MASRESISTYSRGESRSNIIDLTDWISVLQQLQESLWMESQEDKELPLPLT